MTKPTKQEILKKFEELIDESYWNEDRMIDNSSCTDSEYYVRERRLNSEREALNRTYLQALEELLEQIKE